MCGLCVCLLFKQKSAVIFTMTVYKIVLGFVLCVHIMCVCLHITIRTNTYPFSYSFSLLLLLFQTLIYAEVGPHISQTPRPSHPQSERVQYASLDHTASGKTVLPPPAQPLSDPGDDGHFSGQRVLQAILCRFGSESGPDSHSVEGGCFSLEKTRRGCWCRETG